MKIGAVILAGGEGRRIGGDKPKRLLAGKSLFDHLLDRVKFWGLPCAIAVRRESDPGLASGVPKLLDEHDAGPISGISSALRHGEEQLWEAVLTLPCDTPFLPDDLPGRLAGALAPPALAAVPRSDGRLHPACALWSIEAAPALPAYMAERRSLSGFAERLNAARVDWPVETGDPFFNVNTEEDLAAAERRFRSR